MEKLKVTLLNSDDITDECGTKALMLKKLKRMGIKVPDFYGIAMSDFLRFYSKTQALGVYDKIVLSKNLPTGKYIARSSAVPRQKDDLEFASMISGAFDSYFAETQAEIEEKIVAVWESAFSEKAKDQCALFFNKDYVLGIGVVVQQVINPVISGVLHSKHKKYEISWIQGHLSEIVKGVERGNNIVCYRNQENETILRGVEENILKIINSNLAEVFRELETTATQIVEKLGFEIEVEWLYDGKNVWIVQCQKLLTKEEDI